MKDATRFLDKVLGHNVFPRFIAVILAVTLLLFALNPILSHFH